MMHTENCSDHIAVIIVNYKTAKLACKAIESLAQERQYLPNLRIAVIDNDSPDNSFDEISAYINSKAYHDWTCIQRAGENGGYAYGNNLGFKYFSEQKDAVDFYWLLNPDTHVRPKAGLHLANFLKENGPAIAGSRLEDEDGTPQISAFNFPNSLSETLSGFGLGILDRIFNDHLVTRSVTDNAEAVDWVAGASLMISAEVFNKIGLMDQKYFLYFEEVDYCLNIQRLGFICWYVPSSKVVHEVGAATGISDVRKSQPRRPQYWFDSRRRYFLKNFSVLSFIAADLGWAIGYASWYLRKFLTRSEDLNRQPPYLMSDLLKNSLLNPFLWGRNKNIR